MLCCLVILCFSETIRAGAMKLATTIHLVEEAECTHQLGHDLDFMLYWRTKQSWKSAMQWLVVFLPNNLKFDDQMRQVYCAKFHIIRRPFSNNHGNRHCNGRWCFCQIP